MLNIVFSFILFQCIKNECVEFHKVTFSAFIGIITQTIDSM